MKITSFRGQHAFLSNFHPCNIEYEGIVYPSVEHAFQASKTMLKYERKRIAKLETPAQAKQHGRRISLRGDWERVKVKIMTILVRMKFLLHEDLGKKLLATRDAELMEENTWGDMFWGTCDGKGRNELGRILMKTRDELMILQS